MALSLEIRQAPDGEPISGTIRVGGRPAYGMTLAGDDAGYRLRRKAKGIAGYGYWDNDSPEEMGQYRTFGTALDAAISDLWSAWGREERPEGRGTQFGLIVTREQIQD